MDHVQPSIVAKKANNLWPLFRIAMQYSAPENFVHTKQIEKAEVFKEYFYTYYLLTYTTQKWGVRIAMHVTDVLFWLLSLFKEGSQNRTLMTCMAILTPHMFYSDSPFHALVCESERDSWSLLALMMEKMKIMD